MPTPDPATDPSTTLTPEAIMIMRRARIAFFVVTGVTILGLIVVGGTLVYRLTGGGGPAPTAGVSGSSYAAAAVKIPAGATIVSAVASGGQISVTYKNGSATSLRIFDGTTGAILREIPIVSE